MNLEIDWRRRWRHMPWMYPPVCRSFNPEGGSAGRVRAGAGASALPVLARAAVAAGSRGAKWASTSSVEYPRSPYPATSELSSSPESPQPSTSLSLSMPLLLSLPLSLSLSLPLPLPLLPLELPAFVLVFEVEVELAAEFEPPP